MRSLALIKSHHLLVHCYRLWLLPVLLLLCFHLPRHAHAFTLITFDVDGTLVRGSGQEADTSAHTKAFAHACGKILGDGITPTKPVAQALPQHLFHGSTDGLILCRLAKAELDVNQVSESQLEALFEAMYAYIAALEDDQVAKGIEPLPGVLEQLATLAQMQQQPNSKVACGLVTGNVEGIARRKMRAVGVLETRALAPPSPEQMERNYKWPGAQDIGFLGGFGSDYCSRDIQDISRNYLDRGTQIAIAARRCQSTLPPSGQLERVVHVGDAPADVLAAKSYSEQLLVTANDNDSNKNVMCVGMVAVATGSYSAEQLREAAGEPIPGRWEPVVLEQGMADPRFLEACGIQQ
ncbi:haloacid dehalogenase-like hydrolase [Seminavis robusta]|uniref:Haloacid dehalogenase-like hydrolase n=1 Tax=Seminavis robusta TaxID=568900 RepID=A0A9N8H8P0_9STRA|nr:haloacid dehalogenase-like hydrolase [Seminavis robusta]|eukprot:Sro225_g091760.1 haloacid dehalogenase-like hydrolase (351) ;mRNA; r:29309-30361